MSFVAPPRRSRQSCLPCRQRKSKCDDQQPCSSCKLRGTSDQCFLSVDNRHRADSPKRRLVSPPSYQGKKKRQNEDVFHEIASLREGLDRLNSALRAGMTSSIDQEMPVVLHNLDEIIGILPCQRDCEVIIEFVLQEADWLSLCTVDAWLRPIWDRLVYGGLVTGSECATIIAAIAIGAGLLNNCTHAFYPTECILPDLHQTLVSYSITFIIKSQGAPTADPFAHLVFLATLHDALRVGDKHRSEWWTIARQAAYLLEQDVHFTDHRSPFRRKLNTMQEECLRRALWNLCISERWLSLYDAESTPKIMQSIDLRAMPPQWHRTSPSKSFVASGEHSYQMPIAFRLPTKGIPRLFREKEAQELEEPARCANLFLDLSEHVQSVATYVAAIQSWKQLTSTERIDRIARRKHALLLQGLALCDKLKGWGEDILVSCEEPDDLDAGDYFACRRASQATVIHYGRRLMMSIVCDAWVTQYSVVNVDSLYLARIQREAFKNAQEAARHTPLLRTLLSSGTSVKVAWPTLALFNAAVTLAVPLLCLREIPSVTQEFPNVIRIDELPRILHDDAQPTAALRATGRQNVLTMEETRSLAPSILQILEVLDLYKPDLLTDKAKERLSKLVKRLGDIDGSSQSHAPSSFTTRDVDDRLSVDPAGLDLLDSLVSFDYEWWEELIVR